MPFFDKDSNQGPSDYWTVTLPIVICGLHHISSKQWLYTQPGYMSTLNIFLVAFLKLSKVSQDHIYIKGASFSNLSFSSPKKSRGDSFSNRSTFSSSLPTLIARRGEQNTYMDIKYTPSQKLVKSTLSWSVKFWQSPQTIQKEQCEC